MIFACFPLLYTCLPLLIERLVVICKNIVGTHLTLIRRLLWEIFFKCTDQIQQKPAGVQKLILRFDEKARAGILRRGRNSIVCEKLFERAAGVPFVVPESVIVFSPPEYVEYIL